MKYILVVKYKAIASATVENRDALPVLRYAKIFSNRDDAELHRAIHFPGAIEFHIASLEECLVKASEILFP